MKAYKTGWKQEMDKLYKNTLKNWRKTGNLEKPSGISAEISLAKREAT